MKMIDITGERFGRLLVIKYSGKDTDGHSLWECSCECGKTKVIRGKSIRIGDTQSCGCFKRESLIKSRTTHGMKKTKEWRIWSGIKSRCKNTELKH